MTSIRKSLRTASMVVAVLLSTSLGSPVRACPAGTPATIVGATAKRIAGNQNLIDVAISEDVTGSSLPAQWVVTKEPNAVVTVTPLGSASVRLTTAIDLPDDPNAGLTFRALPGTGYTDACGNSVPDASVTVADGIAPLAPALETVQGLGLQDGAFYTNDDSPDVVVGGSRAVEPGYTVELFEETNGTPGLQMATDSSFGDEVATGNTVAITASLGGSDRTTTIYAVSTDDADDPNSSAVTARTLVLDRIAPEVVDLEFLASSVIVTFSEPVPRGRNGASDWILINDTEDRTGVVSVENQATAFTRKLNMHSPYDPSQVMFVAYDYFGPPGNRLEDRASNDLQDFETCLKTVVGSEICPP